ncbi:MAG: AAA family ATPase [Pirellula sp.]|nr:AAA family ATPase [Pirellula sp.]
MDLFAHVEKENQQKTQPLAARMRPASLAEFVGQGHILSQGKLLRRLIDAKRLQSILLFGPPGTGKTTLAFLLAKETNGKFKQLNAVTSGIKELREALEWAKDEVSVTGIRPILFIDEIHRFNKTQQDALLPDVEQGIVTLVGATTSNPFFSVNGALLSRSQIFELELLTESDIRSILTRALADKTRGLGIYSATVTDAALDFCAKMAEGDARRSRCSRIGGPLLPQSPDQGRCG